MLKQAEKFNVDFAFLGCTGHIPLTQSMILSSSRAVSSQITSRGSCMDCPPSIHWFKSDAHLGLWSGTFHTSSMRQIYASVLSSYTCFLMSMSCAPGVLLWCNSVPPYKCKDRSYSEDGFLLGCSAVRTSDPT
jgi:hypothetical protein